MAGTPYPVRVYDDSLSLVAEIDAYETLIWKRSWRGMGEVNFQVNRYVNGADALEIGSFISIYRGGVARLARIDNAGITLNKGGKKSEIWTFTGNDLKGLLAKRLSLYGINTGDGTDTVSATPAETALRHYVDVNCINATDTDRNYPFLELEADAARGNNISYVGRFQPLNQIFEECLLQSPALGYDIVFDRDASKLKLHFIAGTDRSASVQLNPNFGNVGMVDYADYRNGARNIVYVGGTGEGASRTVQKVQAATVTGFDRAETFEDATVATTTDQLTAAGNSVLADLTVSPSIIVDFIDNGSYSYLPRTGAGDFDLGDVVTVVYPEVATVSSRIIETREVYQKSDSGNEQVTFTLGKQAPDFIKMVARIDKKTSTQGRL